MLCSRIGPRTWRLCLLLLLVLAACTDKAVPIVPADVPATSDVAAPADVAPDTALDLTPGVDLLADVELDVQAVDVPAPGTPCVADADCPASDVPCTQVRCDLWTDRCVLVHVADGVTCEDGDSCTIGDACKAGQCKPGQGACNCTSASDCAMFDDGNACNGTWLCDTNASPSHCAVNAASVVKCPVMFDDPCNVSVCDTVSGACAATPTNDGGGCEDGFVCTVGDHCQAGKCAPGPSTCACQKNADCPDDADLCNGKPYCDKSALPFTCQMNPSTLVTCAKSDDTACAANTCDPATGECALKPKADTTGCEDGSVCTKGDHCQGGKCAPGQDLCSCEQDADCGKYDDGDACNGTLYCNVQIFPHICSINPASVVTCQSVQDTACLKNLCQAKTGKCQPTPVAEGKPCDDANACTQDEACASGSCKAVTNLCPCQSAPDCAIKDDGNLCNGLLFCDKSKVPYVCEVNPATVVSCPIGQNTACMENVCQTGTGKCALTPVVEGKSCEEGNSCTTGDVCKGGACNPGPNTCLCQNDKECAKFEDGNVCNGKLFCNKASKLCQVDPNSVVWCPTAQNTTCLASTCDVTTGTCLAKPVHQGLSCDADGNPCTVGDVCLDGQCGAGTNTCSCKLDGDCAPFEDGDKCNGKLYCNKAKVPYQCAVNPSTVVQCPATNVGACKVNACNPVNGLCVAMNLANDSPCDDKKACTVGDVCTTGACAPGTNICGCQNNLDCVPQEDGNWCNGTLFCDKTDVPYQCKVNPATIVICPGGQDSTCVKSLCEGSSGLCKPMAVGQGNACDDGNVCTSGDSCQQGVCTGALKTCDDGNVCSVDDCDALDGCTTLADDASACSDSDACTLDACDAKLGCTHTILASGPCDDGDPCTAVDSCSNGQCLGKGNGCDDANPCTDDGCLAKGCTHAANLIPCGDGLQCIGGTCGGCLAFRRVHRLGCDEIVKPVNGVVDPCASNQNQQREEFEAVARLSDGRIVAVGATSTDKTNKTVGFVTVMDPAGNFVWDKTAGVAGTDRLLAVSATADGGLFAAGVTNTQGPVVRPWLLRLAADGGVVASMVLPTVGTTTKPARFDGVTTLPDGGAIAVGAQDAQASGATSVDALVARFDAQGKLVWQKSLGVQSGAAKPSIDHLWAVQVTPDGTGVVAVGERAQPKSPAQQQDGWAVRLDLAGNVVWHQEMGGTDRDALFGLAFAGDGAVVAVGSTGKATPIAPADGWIVRLDAKGVVQTKDVLAGAGDDVLRSVTRTLQGDWAAVGRMDVDHTGDASWTNGYDTRHAWAVRWDAKWKPLWNKRFDESGLDRLAGVAALANGDVVAVGDTRSSTLPEKPDALVLRLDPLGQDLCGCHLYGTQTNAAGPSILQATVRLDDNRAVAVGTTSDAAGVTDGWLTSYNEDGEAIWQKPVGGPGEDALYDLARDGKGGLLAVGDTTSGAGGADGWVVRFSETGQITSQVTLDRGDDDHIESIASLPGAATGSVDAYLLSGWSSGGSAGKLDGWLVKLDATGKTLWSKAIGSPLDDRFYGAVRLGNGNLLAVGDSKSAVAAFGQYHVWWTVLDATGVQISQQYLPLGYVDGLNSLEVTPDGGAVAAGVSGEILQRGGVVYRFDATGKQTFKSLNGSGTLFWGVVATADGGWIGLGHHGADPFAARWDASAKPVWTSTMSNAGIGSWGDTGDLYDGALLADGTMTAVGQFATKNKGPLNALRIRVHTRRGHSLAHNDCKPGPQCERLGCDRAFGCVIVHDVVPCDDGYACTTNDACSVGKCQYGLRDAQVLQCDDGNPCTGDLCFDALGCISTPSNLTTSCGIDKLCSPNGSCGSCATTSVHFGVAQSAEHFADGAVLADGSLLAVGRLIDPGANPHGWVAHVGTDDKLVSQQMISTVQPSKPGIEELLTAVVPGSGGAGWAVGWTQPGGGNREGWVLQFDAAGVPVWQKQLTGPGIQAFHGAAKSLVGGQIVAVGEDQGAAWIAGLAPNSGALAWQVKLPSPNNNDYLRGAVGLQDGGVVAVGRKHVGKWDGRVVRLNANHAVVWDAELSTPQTDELAGVAVAPDGGFAAVGWRSTNGNDWLVMRLDANGKLLWTYYPEDLYGNNLLLSVLFTGNDMIAAGIGDSNVGALVRLDANGKQMWIKSLKPGPDNWGQLLGIRPGPGNLFTAFGFGYVGGLGEQGWVVRLDGNGKVLCGP